MRPPRLADSRGGLLTTDRPLADNPNPGEKFDANGTPNYRQIPVDHADSRRRTDVRAACGAGTYLVLADGVVG